MGSSELIEGALLRSERYVREFVEGLNLCPYARRCRESGKLERRVVVEPGGPPGSAAYGALLARAIAETRAVEAMPEDAVEVALILFPALRIGLAEFQDLCADVRRALTAFHAVAFHPDLPEDLSDANRAVAFIRRSPDPTVQLVRASLLERVRASRPAGSIFVDPARGDLAHLREVEPRTSVSEEIAQNNLRTLQGRGSADLERLLAGVRNR